MFTILLNQIKHEFIIVLYYNPSIEVTKQKIFILHNTKSEKKGKQSSCISRECYFELYLVFYISYPIKSYSEQDVATDSNLT